MKYIDIMEYQTITNLLSNTKIQPSKLETKYCGEVNSDAHGISNTNTQIKFKTARLNLSLCDYSDAYIIVIEIIIIARAGVDTASRQANEIKKQVAIKILSAIH